MTKAERMAAIEQLKLTLNEQHVSEDDDEYKVEPQPGLTDQQIDNLAQKLLKYAGGFEFYGLGEVTFDGVGQSGFQEY
ncbi:hypothetical protein LL912_16890 [Niabella sp. CC-SYL272]|uniref:hypothetical protein n=1 Tax=Niabella agricola TaxID=2891571 RepID=UPI001F1BFF2F|nr:hypothetical protein [Niabella agricola]MCF3110465.1 hypothetical protein [Niabella agricola]